MESLLDRLPTGRQLQKAEAALAKDLREAAAKYRRFGTVVVTVEQRSEDGLVPFSPDAH